MRSLPRSADAVAIAGHPVPLAPFLAAIAFEDHEVIPMIRLHQGAILLDVALDLFRALHFVPRL